jgi:hypothetical protein
MRRGKQMTSRRRSDGTRPTTSCKPITYIPTLPLSRPALSYRVFSSPGTVSHRFFCASLCRFLLAARRLATLRFCARSSPRPAFLAHPPHPGPRPVWPCSSPFHADRVIVSPRDGTRTRQGQAMNCAERAWREGQGVG